MTQITFADLFGLKNGKMSYDFCVYIDDIMICLIECQGRQHYQAVEYFGGEEYFEIQQFHDDLKREYAFEELHVPLIEIPYTVSEQDIKEMLEPGGLIWEYIDCYEHRAI